MNLTFLSAGRETPRKRIAWAVQEWLSTTIQAVNPFVSDKDIDAGDRGLDEIANQLGKIRTGIVCLTSQNQSNRWINFEAGALSKTLSDKSYVIPLLFDLDSSQVNYPLAQFQWKRFDTEDMAAVARTVNKSLGHPVSAERLETSLNLTWPLLATKIEAIRAEVGQQVLVREPRRTVEDMLEELVVTVREQSQIIDSLNVVPPRVTIIDYHLKLVNEALKLISENHRRYGHYSAKELADAKDDITSRDWDIIGTAPFLLFYLERYYGVTRSPAYGGNQYSEDDGSENLNDVPF